jgi:ABC-2 type transport system permease protein
MNTGTTGWRAGLRIVWAITAKDILEALRNKNVVSVIVVSLLMVVFYRMYPGLARGSELPNVLVYSEGASALVSSLEGSRAFEVRTGYRSAAQMKERLADGEVPELGLVIPAGFDGAVAAGGELVLPGYAMYWVKDADAATLRGSLEDEITRLTGRPATIQLQPRVNHSPDSMGIGVSMGMSVIFVLVMIGLMLVAHLMLEEKKNRTLEVMLVSPASAGHLVAGKALTGLFYTVLGTGVALAINRDLVMHWPLAVATIVVGALFVVAIGLWLGLRIEDRGQLTLWTWILIVPLLIPVFLAVMTPLIPVAVVQVLRLMPTVVLFNLLRTSLADPISIGSALLGLGWVLGWAAAALAVVVWQVRRQDRVAERALAASPAVTFPPGPLPLRGTQAAPRGEGSTPPPSLAGKGAGGLGLPTPLRIVWAIAAKDIGEAMRNRLFISILLGVGLLIVTNAALPLLLYRDTVPIAVAYDASGSVALRELARRRDLRLILANSRAEMARAVTEVPGTRLGLVVPADLGAPAAAGQVIELDGYMAHWAARDKIDQWATFFGQQVSTASGRPVRVNLGAGPGDAGHLLYPAVDAGGEPMMTAILLAITIATLGLALVPLLLIEEKEAHTLDTLLVSPASLGQLITAKAVTGFVYCLVAAAVLMAFKWPLFVSPFAALLAVLLGTGCAVALGLLLGVLSDNPSTLSMWGVGVLLSLIILTAAAFLLPDTWPTALRSLLAWLPGAQAVSLLRYSMAGSVPGALLWSSVAALAGAAAAACALAWLLLRRVRG